MDKTAAELIVNANAVLCALAREKMPVPLAYKIMKWCKSVEDDVAFYSNRFRALVEECGTKGDSVGDFQINPDMRDCFETKLAELRSMEIARPKECFTLEELSRLCLSPSDMAALDPFVKE